MLICDFFQHITPKEKSIFVPVPVNGEEEVANDAVGDENTDLLATAKRRNMTSQHMYSEEVRAAIGKYAAHHGHAAAARHFTRQLRWNVPESTVRKFRDLYKVELQRQAATSTHHGPIAVTTLPPRQRGRSPMLGDLDCVVRLRN